MPVDVPTPPGVPLRVTEFKMVSPYATKPLDASKPVTEAPKHLQTQSESPVFKRTEAARAEADKTGNPKHEKAFQNRLTSRSSIVPESNQHLRDAEGELRSQLSHEARRLDKLRQELGDPVDPAKEAVLKKAEGEYAANFKLAESYAAAQLDAQPGRPTRSQAQAKLVCLANVQVNLAEQFQHVDPSDRDAVADLANRLNSVSLNIVDMRDAVDNVDSGMKARAGRGARRFIRECFNVPNPANAEQADTMRRDIMDRSSMGAEYRRRNYYRKMAADAPFSSPSVAKAYAQVERAMNGDTTAVSELRQSATDVMSATIDEIYATDAKNKQDDADRAAVAKAKLDAQAQGAKPVEASQIPKPEKTTANVMTPEMVLLTSGLGRSLTPVEQAAVNTILAKQSDDKSRIDVAANLLKLLAGVGAVSAAIPSGEPVIANAPAPQQAYDISHVSN